MTKAQIKFFQALGRQKYRKEYNAYLVEGYKNAKEWLQADCRITHIAASATWIATNSALIAAHPEAELITAADFELEKISALQTAQEVVLVAEKKVSAPTLPSSGGWSLLLEKIQDPGNMGTIIRTADWFGIQHIICSEDCVEVYNPKVVQASMGSLLRINITEMDPIVFLTENKQPVYAACLSGRDIREFKMPEPGVIAMGNESRGLSDALIAAAQHKITIPRIGQAESLNVSVATGIICAALVQQ
jgi:TrmH family RNA methyltransferase